MDVGIAAATFAVVIPAELPDKTFVSTVVLGSRHRWLPVWCGAAAALVLQAGISAVAGRLVGQLPHRVVAGIVAALFLAGALYMLFGSESRGRPEPPGVDARPEVAGDAAESTAAEPEPTTAARDAGAAGAGAGGSSVRIAATTFVVVALAELGDLTQILVANLAARERDALSVFVGASVAFVLVSGVGVVAGRTLVRVVPLALVRRISAAMLGALAIWSAIGAAGA